MAATDFAARSRRSRPTATLTLRVLDPQKLWDSATAEYVTPRAGGSPADVEELFGTRDEPNLDACVRELYWSVDDQPEGMKLWDLTEVD